MKRPESHIIEEESRLKFKLSLPRNWVKRDLAPDYGLDFDIQVFNDEVPTPFHFYVQLKSTENLKPTRNGFPLPFKTKYFKLFSQGPFPVMICLFIKSKDTFYYLWLDDYFENLNLEDYKNLNRQKYKTLYLNKNIKYKSLESEIKRLNLIRNPRIKCDDLFNIYLLIKSPKDDTEKIFQEIFRYFHLIKKTKYFKLINAQKAKDSNLIINIDKKYSIIKYSDNSVKVPIKTDGENLHISLGIPICFLLLNNGYSYNSGKMILQLYSEIASLDKDYLYKIAIIISLILSKSDNSLYILEFAEMLKKQKKILVAEFFATTGRMITTIHSDNNQLYLEKFISFCESIIELFDSDSDIGRCYYNMANVLRTDLNNLRKSINYYLKTINFEPDYKNRPYWWAEIAGCFFLINKFCLAEKFYKKSFELGEKNIPVQALIADSLLFCIFRPHPDTIPVTSGQHNGSIRTA